VSAVLSPRRSLAGYAVPATTAVLAAATVALLPLMVASHLQFDAVVALVIGVPCGVVGLLWPGASRATRWAGCCSASRCA
jgi:hypothetical protein